MNKLKIAVYAISKNEERFIDRFCISAMDADIIVIADTGSTDTTVKKARRHGAKVYDICISPWRFDKARDAALALVPGDVDVCISLDIDEVLQPGWRDEIERAWKSDTTRLRYGYDWGKGVVFQYEKIHHRHGYHWHHPCHEYPRADARITEVYAETPHLLVRHLPDDTKSRGQYLGLLELAVKEDPHCPRNAFYYARELTFVNRWADAIPAFLKYLQMPEATWANERAYAMRLIGKAFDILGRTPDALKWYRQACTEAPATREPWCDLALSCHNKQMWAECYSAVKNALAITEKENVYTTDPKAWAELPWDIGSIAAWNLGIKNEALQMAQIALSFAATVDRKRISDNVEFMQQQPKI